MAEKKKERKNRQMDEIEMEKANDEFTFKPKISQRSLRMELNQNSPRRKPQVKAATDSGVGKNKRGQISNQEEFVCDIRTDAEPLLHVDVNLPNKNVRVALYEDSDVSTVARNFVLKYGLEQQMEKTLRQTLEQHMQQAIKDQ